MERRSPRGVVSGPPQARSEANGQLSGAQSTSASGLILGNEIGNPRDSSIFSQDESVTPNLNISACSSSRPDVVTPPQPPPSHSDDMQASQPTFWERERGICQHWLEGNCPRSAEECRFEHEGEVVKIFEKCKFYLSKGCRKGKACAYLHEAIPCPKFHLFDECDAESPCGLSHEKLTDETRTMFEEEAIFWRNKVENQIWVVEEERNDDVEAGERMTKDGVTLLEKKKLLSRINEAIKSKGVSDPDEELESEKSSRLPHFEEVDFASFKAPLGHVSRRSYAIHGTFSNFRYAQKNAARFEAYDEMEKRISKLYNEITIENYDTLSEHVRSLD